MDTASFTTFSTPPVPGEPTWAVALMYPLQGDWTEEQYLSLAFERNWLVEYSSGCVEVLPMPTVEHQLIVKFLLKSLEAFLEPRNLGVVLFAPLPVWMGPRNYRAPDLVFKFQENHAKRTTPYYKGADLVMEVVSDDSRSHERDHKQKRLDYAAAGIPEYWIVDPQDNRITVLALEGDRYVEHGVFEQDEVATSRLLPGFSISVEAVFAAANQ
jgi:Uma2 family endonuclease